MKENSPQIHPVPKTMFYGTGNQQDELPGTYTTSTQIASSKIERNQCQKQTDLFLYSSLFFSESGPGVVQ